MSRSAKGGLMQRSKRDRYSITSSASCWRCNGTSRPSVAVVFPVTAYLMCYATTRSSATSGVWHCSEAFAVYGLCCGMRRSAA